MRLRRRITTLFLASLFALGVAVVPAGAQEKKRGDNVVVVQNETNGATLVQARTSIVATDSDTVDNSNVAIAINSNCVGCHSTAVAVQILIIEGKPSTFTPGNGAAAVNGGCDSCGAYAYARQHFIQISGHADLAGDVRQQIAKIRKEIKDAAASILPSDVATDPCVTTDGSPPPCPTRNQQLDDQLNALSAELIQVVTAGLTDDGDNGRRGDDTEIDGDSGSD